MNVTNVRVRIKTQDNERVKANVSIVFDNCFVVNGIRVVKGNNDMFVAMPSERVKPNEGFKDIVHPINAECRKMIHEAVMKEYEKELAKLAERTTEENKAE